MGHLDHPLKDPGIMVEEGVGRSEELWDSLSSSDSLFVGTCGATRSDNSKRTDTYLIYFICVFMCVQCICSCVCMCAGICAGVQVCAGLQACVRVCRCLCVTEDKEITDSLKWELQALVRHSTPVLGTSGRIASALNHQLISPVLAVFERKLVPWLFYHLFGFVLTLHKYKVLFFH